MSALSDYLKNIEQALKAGSATEHTHRPALKALVESLRPGITATNEPQRIACGAPDFIVTRKATPLGYIEAKDVGVDLDRTEDSEQLKRYRTSLRNLILTDYLEFRQYRNGDLVQTVRLGKWQKNGILWRDAAAKAQLETLLQAFFDAEVPTISSPRELAERMARLARLLHDLIRETFAHEGKKGDLHAQYEAFKKVLVADLSIDQFADMYAQTIAYGLFAARCNHIGTGFTRERAGRELPKTNPFLRKLFNTIAGADLDERISWAVDDLAELLAKADMAAILEDFGKVTRREDPVVHFYETFLAAYDPKLRETRGVYFTPEPVVSYIVRSIDAILKKNFGLKTGLADRSMVKLQIPTLHAKKTHKEVTTHRVQILDPACGTGTFLYAVVAQIKEGFSGVKGLWPSYVAQHLLPRLYGFELLMAPYAVAHMKLGLQLEETGYDFAADERLRVFLTNSLEEGHEFAGLPLFAQWLADEAAAASEVKREAPIMVVLGNPPYSGISSNTGKWIENLIGQYKREPDGSPLKEHKHWLNDDYVKFLRFAQWRIEQTGYGVLGFVTNHGYLDNPTFRGMRHSLLQTFDKIYLIDLHGNSKKKEKAPDGGKDQNVFDIQQGVAICLMVRTGIQDTEGTVHHADLWGTRSAKYEWLEVHDASSTSWETLKPERPFLFFYPRNDDFEQEYHAYPSVKDIFPLMGLGFQSSRDHLVVGFTRDELVRQIQTFSDSTVSDEEIRSKHFPGKKVRDYASGDTRQWSLSAARAALRVGADWEQDVRPTLYRPFDVRFVLYNPRMVDWPRPEVLGHMLQENLCLLVNRQSKEPFAALCADLITERKIAAVYDASTTIPLYLHNKQGRLLDDITVNMTADFESDIAKRLKMKLTERGHGDLETTFGPEDVLAYIYAVFYSPTYRTRYATFLKTDFPRVPMTNEITLFKKLVGLGQQLIDLHLMRSTGTNQPDYPVKGSNLVERMEFDERGGRVYINADQYFEGVAKGVWEYHIGGYQVAHKWLKDRKGRLLTFNELDHYRRVIAALELTIRLQDEIDRAIPSWPLT